MQTSSAERIACYSHLGWWGDATLQAILNSAVRSFADRTALVDPPNKCALVDRDPQAFSFSEIDREVDRLGALLYAHGVRCDDRVVTQLPNIAECLLVYFALARLGAIIVPVATQYRRHELQHIAALIQPAAYITVAKFRQQPLFELNWEVFGAGVTGFTIVGDADGGITLEGEVTRAMQLAHRNYVDGIEYSANDILTVCWTSGTTGVPKGVPRSYNQWFSQVLATYDSMAFGPDDVYLTPFPFINMAGFGSFFFIWLLEGGCMVLHHPLDLDILVTQIAAERVTHTIVAPAILHRLLQNSALGDAVALSTLRYVGAGSAPLSPWLVSECQRQFGIEVVNFFGSNEGCALVSAPNDIPDPERRAFWFPRFGAGSRQWDNRAGQRLSTRLVDLESGDIIEEPDHPGELQLKGPNVFDGYLAEPEENARAFTADGWFRSGDLLAIAGVGELLDYYRYVGRCKEIINRGGIKISPNELDAILAELPGVLEVACFAVPDEELGERIGIAVVAAGTVAPVLADINAFLKAAGVARVKWPEHLLVVDALPRNPVGKVQRETLAGRMA